MILRWSGLIVITLALLGLFMVLGLIGLLFKKFGPVQKAAAMLPQERRAMRQAGLLLGPQDLNPANPIPNSENAAPLYKQIFLSIPARFPKNQQDSLTAILKGKATSADRRTLRDLLAALAPQMKLAERAVTLPTCRFPRDYALGPDLKLPEYACARSLVRLFAVRAILQNESGHPKEALRSVETADSIGRQIGEDPILIGMLVQIAIEAIGDRVWLQIVKSNHDKSDVLQLAAQTDRAVGPPPDLRYFLRSEIVMQSVILKGLRAGRVSSDYAQLASLPLVGSKVMVDALEARSLAYWRRFFAVLNDPADKDLMQIYYSVKKLDKDEVSKSNEDISYKINAIMAPIYDQLCLKLIRCEAQRRLRRVTLSLIAYHLRTRRFPANLSDLNPPAPLDPYLDLPLHYRRTANGFVLYSVGDNLKDDGGDEVYHGKESPRDIVVSYP